MIVPGNGPTDAVNPFKYPHNAMFSIFWSLENISLIVSGRVLKSDPYTETRPEKNNVFFRALLNYLPRVTKSENFPDSKIFVAKTFRKVASIFNSATYAHKRWFCKILDNPATFSG